MSVASNVLKVGIMVYRSHITSYLCWPGLVRALPRK